ncbi:MAG: cation transporter [Bacteroidales bacterium]|nr:cation transporter [Bacteroidales bacterium]
MSIKTKTARLSILSNTILIILKLVAGIISGSVSIISEAIHSFIDLIAAIMAFYSVKISSNPPDKRHPYGHGKYENISGVIEALLIFFAAIWIIFEAVKKMQGAEKIEFYGIGIIVMFISALINFFISRKLYKVSKTTDSIALEADALHLSADVYTSAGVALSLLLIWLTGWHILDPIVAIIVALFILKEAYLLIKIAFKPLVDESLSEDEINIISNIIRKSAGSNLSFHRLRTRKAGFIKFIDLHLELPGNLSVNEAHLICDNIEKEIENKIKNSEVTIHVEPS